MGPETIPEEKGECRVRLLLVEDDEEISAMLGDFLESEGFSVDTAADGEAGCARFSAAQYDLVLLDLMLPRRSGLDVLRAIRKSGSTVPVIILSARDSDSDVTLDLGLGADDYVVKPFSVSQVLARIKANLRRSTVWAEGAEAPAEVLRAGALAMDCAAHRVEKDGIPVELTAKEYSILELLLRNPRRVYTKAQLYAAVWGEAYLGDENAVNVHISRLRSKVEDDPKKPRCICTVWGIGYKLGDGDGR